MNNEEEFAANTDQHTKVTIYLGTVVAARFVRLVPTMAKSHIALRVGVLTSVEPVVFNGQSFVHKDAAEKGIHLLEEKVEGAFQGEDTEPFESMEMTLLLKKKTAATQTALILTSGHTSSSFRAVAKIDE